MEYLTAWKNPTQDYYNNKIWDTLLKKIHLPIDRKINYCEAMCGSADAINIFEKYCFTDISYSAFDYSPKMVAIAKEKHPKYRIYEQDITTFYEPNTYDIIVVMLGLHHVNKHTKKVLSNIYNSLKPGGFFFSLETTYGNSFFAKIRDLIYKHSVAFDYETEKDFSVHELNMLAAECNLTLERQIYPGLLSYVLLILPVILANKTFCKRLLLKSIEFGGTMFRKYIDIESSLWGTSVARFFSFTTFACYRKH